METYAIVSEVLAAALLAVDDDDSVGDAEAGGAERSGGLKDGGAAGDEVLDDEARLAGAEGALDGAGGAVVLHLLAAHDHRDGAGEGDAGGDGEGGVGNAADEVDGGGNGSGGGGIEEVGDAGEEGRVRDDEAEVDVDGGGDARLELEAAELDGLDLVQLRDDGLHGSSALLLRFLE